MFVVCKRKTKIKDYFKDFGRSNWKDGDVIYIDKENCQRSWF
jgi:hypothetical protein